MNTCKKYFYFWSILINLLFACKKEGDTQPPVITISVPVYNQAFNVGDELIVQGNVSDESSLKKVAITLLNEQEQPVHRTLSVDVSSNDQVINTSYLLDNIHLESGAYKLCIFASDGTNDVNTYIPVYIIAIPRVLEKIMIATVSTASQTAISTIDSAGTVVSYTNFSGDHLELSVNSYFQELFHCGNATGNFTGIALRDKRVVVNVPVVPSSSVPYFTGFYEKNDRYYISFYNELVKGYDHTGNITYNATALSGYVVKKMCLNDQHLIAEEQNKITKEQKLVCYYSTGVAEQNLSMEQEVTSFCERDDAHVMVFGNKAGQGVIQEYDRIANSLWEPYPYKLPGEIKYVLKLDKNTYLLAISNGNIYKYVYTASSVTSFLTGYTAIQMVWDELNNTLYVVEKNKISKLDMKGNPMQTINSATDILKMGLLYNR